MMGKPKSDPISTSFVERHDLTIQMSMKRYSQMSNEFSWKLENHRHAMALFILFHNWMPSDRILRRSRTEQRRR